jgi:hypothetical protein
MIIKIFSAITTLGFGESVVTSDNRCHLETPGSQLIAKKELYEKLIPGKFFHEDLPDLFINVHGDSMKFKYNIMIGERDFDVTGETPPDYHIHRKDQTIYVNQLPKYEYFDSNDMKALMTVTIENTINYIIDHYMTIVFRGNIQRLKGELHNLNIKTTSLQLVIDSIEKVYAERIILLEEQNKKLSAEKENIVKRFTVFMLDKPS